MKRSSGWRRAIPSSFVGLSQEEIARALAVSEPTVRRHWSIARAWLYAEIKANEGLVHENGNDCEKKNPENG